MKEFIVFVVISEDLYFSLPEKEQETFEWVDRYRDDPKDDDWRDPNEIFATPEDLMAFFGTEHQCYATGSVYRKRIDEKDEEEWIKKGKELTPPNLDDEPDAPFDPVTFLYLKPSEVQ